MKDKLRFTYGPVEESEFPTWEPGTPRADSSTIWWKPSIGCTEEKLKRGQSLTSYPGIPWYDISIAEIRVESRKVYEILCRIVPDSKEQPLVRIVPPTSDYKNAGPITGEYYPVKKRRLVTIFTNGEKVEQDLAAAIASALDQSCVICSQLDLALLEETEFAVFCNRSSSTEQHLADALARECEIVSSDAGSSEEFLCKFATPGKWHVAKSWERREWIAMIRDLLGEKNNLFQTSVVDDTPYTKIWEAK